MKIRTLCALTAATMMFGCALPVQRPDYRVDGKPPLPEKQVVRIAPFDQRTYPGQPLKRWWEVVVTSVDGKPIPKDSGYIQIAPGTHSIAYKCHYWFSTNDAYGGGHGQGNVTLNFPRVGETYYAQAAGQLFVYGWRQGVFSPQGSCTVRQFSQENPFWG